MGRRLLEDTNRRLRAFREKGGGRYPKNEMLERAVQEAGLRHLGDPFRGGRNRAEMPTLRGNSKCILESKGEKVNIHR